MFTLTSESGQTFSFVSEEAFEAANDWYGRTEKDQIVEFCAARGGVLVEATDDPYYSTGLKLVEDWAFVAMELYAKDA